MSILFLAPCGEFEGQLKKIVTGKQVHWILATKDGPYYKFIGNTQLLESYQNHARNAIIYGDCQISAFGDIKLEAIEIKPLFEFELELITNKNSEPGTHNTIFNLVA